MMQKRYVPTKPRDMTDEHLRRSLAWTRRRLANLENEAKRRDLPAEGEQRIRYPQIPCEQCGKV